MLRPFGNISMSRTARRTVISFIVVLSSYVALYFLLAAFSYDWSSSIHSKMAA
jgi:hypothetical protein